MAKKDMSLTKSEEDLMEIFWLNKAPLTSIEILEITKDRSWNGNYLHVMLRSLLEKNMIRICGVMQYGKQYARQFEATMTRNEYGAKLILSQGFVDSISQVTVALAKQSETIDKEELISQLQEIIEKLKAE